MLATKEHERLSLLRDLDLLDADADPSFEAVTEVAAEMCGTSISLVSLVDVTRQFFSAQHGLESYGLHITETPIEASFCAHAIRASLIDGVFEVRDTHSDERFRNNDLVLGNPKLRFYAGVPLRPLGDSAVGTLCVLDSVPSALTAQQSEHLLRLASIVEQLMRLRLVVKTEAQLLERAEKSERYYRYLAEHTDDVVLVNDANLAMTFYSPNMPAFFGYTSAEVDALPAAHPYITVAGSPIQPSDGARLTPESPSRALRATGWHKDGSTLDLSLEVLAVYEGDQFVEFRSTVRDIGGLVAYEHQLREANRELLAAETRRSHSVRNLTHDLAAPLAAIRITAESICSQIPESKLRTQVERLVEYSQHAQSLVGDLRVVNDPDGGEPTMSLAPHNLAGLIERVASQFLGGPTADVVSLDLVDVQAVVDASAFTRIITNLLTNVVAHNPAGTKAWIRLSQVGDEAVLRVEDDGVGIPMGERARMLEPYAGLNPNGSGLGLAITDSLVAAHGGTVRIEGNSPSGTAVQVSIPCGAVD